MDQLTELTLPRPAFETSSQAPKITVDRREIPWLPSETEDIQLKRRTLTDGTEFFLASVIRGRRLEDAANQLDRHRKQITDNLFNSALPDFIRGHNTNVRSVERPVTRKPIHVVGNPGGQRVYFMRFGSIEGLPIILRLAVCDKAKQPEVLAVLTGTSVSKTRKGAKS